ncbi:MAG TPA: hypothetical protein ENH55_07515, partial [Aurantimonas coralicida]|nr:hypothetical protein [Aurantimonas coralicida]
VAQRARRTGRMECIVHHLGLALGGRPAACFAQRLMMPVSNDTLLRVVRMAVGSSGRSAKNCMVVSRWPVQQHHSVRERVAIHPPHGI